jgi:hypothetical protein
MSWEDKAASIISNLCTESYRQANLLPNGTWRKKHRPYTVPPLAQQLVDILGLHDRVEAEERTKALFLMYENPTATMQW